MPSRPILRYHGGKWKLAPWVISHFPPHRVYVEPYGGGASVLMRKNRSYAEVYNDLDGEVVNIFRVLRDAETAEQLREAVSLTPFSRDDFEAVYSSEAKDPVERARCSIVKSFMGFGTGSIHDHRPQGMRTRATRWAAAPTGFRNNSYRSGSTPATDWTRYPSQIPLFVERLRGVVIENRDALEVIAQHDAPDTLHYVDPPYIHSTRSERVRGGRKGYLHEMTDEDHRQLAGLLHSLSGMVVLSGYPCGLYDEELYPDWKRLERGHRADAASLRTEVLWINSNAKLLQLEMGA